MTSIAIVEDNDKIRDLIRQYLDNQENYECKMAFDSVEALLKEAREGHLPDVILISNCRGCRVLME